MNELKNLPKILGSDLTIDSNYFLFYEIPLLFSISESKLNKSYLFFGSFFKKIYRNLAT